METQARARRQRRHGGSESTLDAGPDPLPPYQVSGVEMVYLQGTLSRPDLARQLPDGIAQAASKSCMIALYNAARGWGIAPFTATYARIALSGRDSPDSSEAMFQLGGQASGLAGHILRRDYSGGFEIGPTRLSCTGRHVSAEGGFGAGTELRIEAEFADETVIATAGAHRELGQVGSGLVEWTGAYDTKYRQLRVTQFLLQIPPNHPLSILRHFKLISADWLFEKSFTLSEPRPADRPDRDAAMTALATIVDALHSRTVLIDSGGQIGHASPAARSLFGSAQALRLAFADVWARETAEPYILMTHDGAAIVRLLPVGADLWGAQARLAILSLPNERSTVDVSAQLRLMGLTPAEARIAAAMSEGVTTPMAAARLGLTSHTVRSALKSVYIKQGITHRSELGAMLVRLAA